MKRILYTLNEKWPEYLLEIMVLIIGIYGAFAVDNWNDERKSNESEKRFLVNLKSEIIANQLSLEDNINWHKTIYDHIVRFMDLTGPDANTIDQSTFDSLIYSTIRLPSYEPVKENISSAELDDLEANELKVLIAQWGIKMEDYQRAIKITYDLYYHYIYPELSQHYQMKNMKGPNNNFGLKSRFDSDQLALLRNLKFENHLLMRAVNAQNIYFRAIEIDELEERIIEEIDKKLKDL